MKPPSAASPGRGEKPQLPAPAVLVARLLLSKSRRAGGRSRRARSAPATSPMFASRGRISRAGAVVGEPSSPKVTCIGQVRMRKGKNNKKKTKSAAVAGMKAVAKPEKVVTKGYCRCLKKAFLCGGMFEFDRRRRTKGSPPPSEVERSSRRSPWVFSSRDVAVAAAPKPVDDARSEPGDEEEGDEMAVGVRVFGSVLRSEEVEDVNGVGGDEKENAEEQLVPSSATASTPPKNALLLMRCRSAPQHRTSPLISRFPVAAPFSPSPTTSEHAPAENEVAAWRLSLSPRDPDEASPAPSPSPSPPARKADRLSPAPPSPSPRRASATTLLSVDVEDRERRQQGAFAVQENQAGEEDDEMRCSSARPLVLQRCKSEPATTAATKMAAEPEADATTAAGCFWPANGGRRRHAPAPPPVVQ